MTRTQIVSSVFRLKSIVDKAYGEDRERDGIDEKAVDKVTQSLPEENCRGDAEIELCVVGIWEGKTVIKDREDLPRHCRQPTESERNEDLESLLSVGPQDEIGEGNKVEDQLCPAWS